MSPVEMTLCPATELGNEMVRVPITIALVPSTIV